MSNFIFTGPPEDIRLCEIRKNENEIVLAIRGTLDDATYPIPIDRCDTQEKLIGWIDYISQKEWSSCLHIHQLIIEVCKHFDWPKPSV
jgi:hypothetical protein